MAQLIRDYAILHVDDSLNDQLLVQEAARLSQPRLVFIPIGTFGSAAAYLEGTGPFADREQFPLPDLVLLDWKLDSCATGLDLLRWMRARKDLSRLPAVIYSGTATAVQIRDCYLSGANYFLAKASEFARLVPILNALEQLLVCGGSGDEMLRSLPEYRSPTGGPMSPGDLAIDAARLRQAQHPR